jgi:hypothetical protein
MMREQIVVEVEIGPEIAKHFSVGHVMYDVHIIINDRKFRLIEIMAALLKLGDDVEEMIDYMRADTLGGGKNWFRPDSEEENSEYR